MEIKLDVSLITRNDSEQNWSDKNPILSTGERGVVTSGEHAGMSKTGDGVTNWNNLGWDKAIANGGNADTVGGKTIPDGIATFERYTATLSASGWSSSAPYTQTVSISGIQSSDFPVVDIILSDQSQASSIKDAWGNVDKIESGNGSITAYCYDSKPSSDIPIQLLVTRN